MIRLFDLKRTQLDLMFDMIDIRCNYMHICYPEDSWFCNFHSHTNYEISYIFSGKGICNINNKEFEAKQGDLFLIPPNSMHYEAADKDAPFNIMFLKIDHLGENTKELHEMFVTASGKAYNYDKELISFYFDKILTEIYEKKSGYITIVNAILRDVYIAVLRERFGELSDSPVESVKSGLSGHMRLFKQVEQYIYSNLGNNITIKTLANRFHYHPKYLSQIFKEVTGTTMSEHIMNIRLSKACDALLYSDVSIATLGTELGFTNSTGFCKFFKKKSGYTPSAYRHMIRISVFAKNRIQI